MRVETLQLLPKSCELPPKCRDGLLGGPRRLRRRSDRAAPEHSGEGCFEVFHRSWIFGASAPAGTASKVSSRLKASCTELRRTRRVATWNPAASRALTSVSSLG